LGTYDAIIGDCLDHGLANVEAPVLDVLRLGAHQLLAMRVGAHAAVSTSVDLVRAQVGHRPARLVNAVLRAVGRRDLDEWTHRLAPRRDADPIAHLAFRHSHPEWIAAALSDALGTEVLDELERCLIADNQPASVTLVARPGRCEVSELVEAGAVRGNWSPYAARLMHGDPAAIAAVQEGRAGVQDEGSQLVTIALADAPLEGSDKLWLDMCAGPGGKAALLAGMATERGAGLVAVEQHEHRARLVRQALHGDRGAHEVLVGDATSAPWGARQFDRVLLDAPCTGLGALRRRPEARWRRSPQDVADLRSVQIALLHAALEATRPGGLVAYVTCSPHLSETATVVGQVADDHRSSADNLPAEFEWVDARPLLPGVPALGPGPHVQLWPHRHDTDAMFLALLRRTT
jgi:16S rRNA (cytosine967-C5)-methyltransferase